MQRIQYFRPITIVIALGFILSNGIKAQQCDTLCGPNLAPNPNFEQTTVNCADTVSEMFTNYSQVTGWYGIACDTCPGNGSTPDYNNSLCNGPAQSINCGSGNGSIGYFSFAIMGSNAREYVQAQLTSPLAAGVEYCVSISARSNNGSIAYDRNDGLGLWFTNQMVDIDVQNGGQQFIGPGSIINATPQVENTAGNIIDTVCQTISGTFTATGTEQYVVIGNFRNDANTTSAGDCSFLCTGYIIIDDISIRTSCTNPSTPPTISLTASNDTLCEGECTPLNANVSGGTNPITITWDNGLPNGTGPHVVCPTITTTYTAIATDSVGLADTASITVVVNGTDTTNTSASICSGDSLFLAGAWQTSAGNYYDSLSNSNGCDSILVTALSVTPSDTAGFNYSANSFCLTDSDPTPTITGTTSGVFTIDNGGTINGATGEINLTASGIGTFTISYTTSGPCPDSSSITITIVNALDATITQVGPFCENDSALQLTAVNNGGIWSGTGITNTTNGTFDPSVAGPGSHVIGYTISGNCGDNDTVVIQVNPSDTANFTYSSNTFCDTDPNPIATISGTTGGSFSINNGGVINSTTGEVNLMASGLGSYTISYITTGSCPDSATFSLTITNCTTPTAAYSVSDSVICEGDCVTFTDQSTGATSYTWTFNGGSPATASNAGPHNVCFNGAGNYTIELIVTNSNGADTTTSTITVHPSPTVDAGPDVTIDLGQSVNLNASGSNGTYTWTPPTWLDCINCTSPVSTPDETITYTVIVVDSNGCSASDEVTIIVDFDYVIWVPNIFSPNGDGNNDIAYVRGKGVKDFTFVIYDRWGEKVFETSDLNIGWDGTFRGKAMNNAVFVYYLEATFLDGTETTKKGDITLIR